MKAVKVTNSKPPRKTRLTTKKKTTKSAKGKFNVSSVAHPELRKQMIEDAAYFKALNRDFQGDYCEEDWLEAEAEAEIDASINGDVLEALCVEDWQETETRTDSVPSNENS